MRINSRGHRHANRVDVQNYTRLICKPIQGNFVLSALWNLIAAILCTIAAAVTTVAAYLSEPSLISTLTIIAGVIGTLGGAAWVVAAILGVRQR